MTWQNCANFQQKITSVTILISMAKVCCEKGSDGSDTFFGTPNKLKPILNNFLAELEIVYVN